MTDTERLLWIARIVAMRRAEAMGTYVPPAVAPQGPNWESLLVLAIGPDTAVDGIPESLAPLLGPFQGSTPAMLWRVVVADIKRLFPRSGWPSWIDQ